MMGKNKILVGCLALLLALSVGYALFSETITINGTATAKGNFDISYTCEIVTSADAVNVGGTDYYTKGGTGTCEIVDGIVKTSSNLTKPSDVVFFLVEAENTGTISANLKTVDSSNIHDENLNAGDAFYVDEDTWVMASYAIIDEGNNIYATDSDAENAGLVLESGDKLSILIRHEWMDKQNTQQALPDGELSFDYNMSLSFEQVTVN